MFSGPGGLGQILSGLSGEADRIPDAGETLWLSPLALLKMLKHCRAGVPMEVMGLMLGELVDDITITVVDVFAMPQNGTGQNVESIDEVFQTEMVDRLRRVGRSQPVVGWYHSHPSFGCWLSMVDTATQESMEKMDPRQVALVIDPIQSVRGKVMLDCFRCVPKSSAMQQKPFQEATSINGFTRPPQPVAVVRGLDKMFYSMPVAYSSTEEDDSLLRRMGSRTWMVDMGPADEGYARHTEQSLDRIRHTLSLLENYKRTIRSEGVDIAMAARAVLDPSSLGSTPPSTSESNGSSFCVAAIAAASLAGKHQAEKTAEERRAAILKRARDIFAHRIEAGHMDPERHLQNAARQIMMRAVIQKEALESLVLFSYQARLPADRS